METNWFLLILIALLLIVVLLTVIIKNKKDRKNLFKKMPGDYPDPKEIKSEFDKIN